MGYLNAGAISRVPAIFKGTVAASLKPPAAPAPAAPARPAPSNPNTFQLGLPGTQAYAAQNAPAFVAQYGGYENLPTVGASPQAAAAQGFSFTPNTLPLSPVHDSIYNSKEERAKRLKAFADANFTYSLAGGANRYGLQANVDPSGQFTLSEVDPSSPDYNPFNQMAMLRQHFQQSQTGNKNSYAARGQLYAGSLQNAQNEAQQGYNADYSNLQGSFGDFVRGQISDRLGQYGQADDIIGAAGADETQRQIQNAPPAPTPPPPSKATSLPPTPRPRPGTATKTTQVKRRW